MRNLVKPVLQSVLLFFLCLILVTCHNSRNEIQRGFYYWKTNFDLSSGEKTRWEKLKVQKLYARFFDVSLNEANEAVPIAKFYIDSTLPDRTVIIPVIYITNNTLLKIADNKTEALATNILNLVDKTAKAKKITYEELQLDCDWTLQTKNKYFNLLEAIRKITSPKKIILSCTIRLHQVKYYKKTGIPPVDRGMLMFYNMGKLEDSLINSIYNSADASRYVASIKNYPLSLDIALPVFSWAKQYREGRMIGLMNEVNESGLRENPIFTSTAPHRFRSLKSMFFQGGYIQEGDLIVAEEVTPSLAREAAELLQKNFPDGQFTVVLYHWDNSNLSIYGNKEIEDIYHCFE